MCTRESTGHGCPHPLQGPQKTLARIERIITACCCPGPALTRRAQRLQQALKKVLRCFGPPAEGHPSDAGEVWPLLDKVQGAMTRVQTAPRLQVHAVAGDRGFKEATRRQALPARGIRTIGLPKTVAAIQTNPSPRDMFALLNEAGLHRKRTPHHVPLACACGSSRPVGESPIARVLARGAGHGRDKGHPGALGQVGMAAMAHHGAVGGRIRQRQLSKRAQKFRRLLGVKKHNIKQINDQKKLAATKVCSSR